VTTCSKRDRNSEGCSSLLSGLLTGSAGGLGPALSCTLRSAQWADIIQTKLGTRGCKYFSCVHGGAGGEPLHIAQSIELTTNPANTIWASVLQDKVRIINERIRFLRAALAAVFNERKDGSINHSNRLGVFHSADGGEAWVVQVSNQMNEFQAAPDEEKRRIKKAMLSGEDTSSWWGLLRSEGYPLGRKRRVRRWCSPGFRWLHHQGQRQPAEQRVNKPCSSRGIHRRWPALLVLARSQHLPQVRTTPEWGL
jgi:hypothetical protein